MKVNIISETVNGPKANGVHSAFLEVFEGLKRRGIDVKVNSRGNCDVIHSHTLGPYYLLSTAGKRSKTIISAHVIPDSMKGSLALWKYWLPLFTKYMKYAYNRARIVVAVSPTVKQELLRLGITSKVEFIPNSIDIKKFVKDINKRKKFRNKYKIKQSELAILSVGQIQPRKGIETFCNVAKKLPEIKFIWVGTRPFSVLTADYNKANELMKNAPENVIFTGFVDDILEAYSGADAFFFPSHQENHPVAVIEAAASGLPIVLRDIPEYISVFKNYYLKANSDQDFASIIKSLKGKKEYNKAKENAEKLAEMYSTDKIIDKIIGLYSEIAK